MLICFMNFKRAILILQHIMAEKKIEKEGVIADLVEMTKDELGFRNAYDDLNALIIRRRNAIRLAISDLGYDRVKGDEEESTPAQKKLSSLVINFHYLPDETDSEFNE